MADKDNIHEGKTFDKIDYQDKVVVDREFTNCTFVNCTLTKTTFEDCEFDNCTFDKCDLSLMKVKGCSFNKVQIKNSKAIGILWYDAKSPFSGTPFYITCEDSNISYSSFFGRNLKKAKFVRCVAKEVDFSGCNLTEAVFTETDLELSRFSDSDLSAADFVGARNYYIDVRANKVKRAKFSMPEAMSLLSGLDVIIV